MIMFVTGGMTVILAYVFWSMATEDNSASEEIAAASEGSEPDIVVNDSGGRLHTLYCESCRKKKRHREIMPRKFECTRCKRITDLRIPS